MRRSRRSGGWLKLAGWRRGGTGSAVGEASLSDDWAIRLRYPEDGATPVGMDFDRSLFWVVTALIAWGIVMVYSATIALPDNPRFATYAHTHYLLRHAVAVLVGLSLAMLAYQVEPETWERASPWLFGIALLLLLLVLVPGVGKGVNGARRWLPFGLINFQPSEFAKLAVLTYAAHHMVRHMAVKEHFFKAVFPMSLAVSVMGGLLMAEPDMGAALVVVVIAMGILFLGGVNIRIFVVVTAVIGLAFALIIFSSPWRLQRVMAYLDPFSPDYAQNKGYQLTHALIAFGRGEIQGVGLGASVEKLHWLPEAHTDFLLSVIGEEFGLMGVWVLMAMFVWMIRRIMLIGRQAIALDQVFEGLMVQGISLWIGFQAFINFGVNLGALPTKGLTLPFMSYGGSALVINMVAIALVLRVDQGNRKLMHGGRE